MNIKERERELSPFYLIKITQFTYVRANKYIVVNLRSNYHAISETVASNFDSLDNKLSIK